MVIRVRNTLGRQSNKKIKKETKTQTVEQKILQVLNGLQGGCYRMNCIRQAFSEPNNSVLSEQIASVFNDLIISGQVRLSRIRLNHGRVTVYFTVKRQKTKVIKK